MFNASHQIFETISTLLRASSAFKATISTSLTRSRHHPQVAARPCSSVGAHIPVMMRRPHSLPTTSTVSAASSSPPLLPTPFPQVPEEHAPQRSLTSEPQKCDRRGRAGRKAFGAKGHTPVQEPVARRRNTGCGWPAGAHGAKSLREHPAVVVRSLGCPIAGERRIGGWGVDGHFDRRLSHHHDVSHLCMYK